ncbi:MULTISPECIES: inositol monophosphatase [Halobacterium]|uniref:inositol monophosphatase family protein n=1 Tax=Halobacterium TaxID=2239 RepID=UPI00196662C3|nr:MULTISPECIES: inositol monophosphatase [Halobacterium]MDL0122178.1 inositol monophosphatase [Halobacterium salinarum]MDL0124484.1 inositol monophosphatase [Halobacterium salinarum]MDL0126877.1 inositol monophosphatase [Halobacterium salinarum]MDL0134261.1 inositol monophosphatase [Halobacterium salinarum]QRY23853.1 inositol monophosphatase [Halobacterium sp. BOL4-2]
MHDTDRVSVAERAARTGGAVALDAFRTGIDVETKSGKTDVVTEADRTAQRRVVDVIDAVYDEDTIVGEEADALKTVPDAGAAWVIDPIDGTNNFVRDTQLWATAVAAVVDGTPVAACNRFPALEDTYIAGADGATLNGAPISVSEKTDPETFVVAPTIWWDFDRRDEYAAACAAIVERFGDMRRYGCAQAVLSMVASGQLEATITNVVANPWDSVAGVHLVRQAGGVVTDIDGTRWTPGATGLVASNGTAHDAVLAAAQEIRAAAE